MADEREIFQYFNGKTNVWGDPVVVYERLAACLEGDINAAIAATNQGLAGERPASMTDEEFAQLLAQETATQPLREAASTRLREAVRNAFAMAPWNPQAENPEDVGATAKHCREALDALNDFLDQKKSD